MSTNDIPIRIIIIIIILLINSNKNNNIYLLLRGRGGIEIVNYIKAPLQINFHYFRK